MSDTSREVTECIAELVEGGSLLKARRSVSFELVGSVKNYIYYRGIHTFAILACPQI